MRPSLSPALPCLALTWCGIAASLRAHLDSRLGSSWGALSPEAALAAGCVLALAACGLVALRSARMRGFALLGVTSLAAGLLTGWLRMGVTLDASVVIPELPVSRYEILVLSDPSPSELGGYSCQADVSLAGSRAGRIWVHLPDSAADVRLGSRLEGVGRWDTLETGEWDRSLALRGFCASASLTTVHVVGAQEGVLGALRTLRAGLLDGIDLLDEGLALTAGVVLGQQSALSETDAYRSFSNLGLTHLVAVSGSHLAVVAGTVAFGLRAARATPRTRLVLTLLVLGCYVVLSGLQPSAVRSLLMVVCALSGMLAARRSHALSALALAALAMVLLEPTMTESLGFALSVLSVLGIACFGRFAQAWTCALLPAGVPDAVTGPLSLTLVAQAFTLPLTLPTFGVLPLLSPLANVLVAPLMSGLLLVGLVCLPLSAVLPVPLSDVMLWPCRLLGGTCCRLADALAAVPYAAVPFAATGVACGLGLAAAALAAYVAWPRPDARRARSCGAIAALLVLGVLLSWRFLGPARVVVLDVGQGDAILVQHGAHALLVDTGPDEAVVEALARMHVIHLDAVLLTHTDADHVGGLDDLANLVRVDEVIVATGTDALVAREKPELARLIASLTNDEATEVGSGDVIDVGGFELEVLAPERVDEGGNEDSVVCVARFVGPDGDPATGVRLSVLLTGDAEAEQVEPLASSGTVGEIDVLKVGHHGSAASTSAEMLEALDPSIAVASAGEGNRYGHPTQECRDLLEAAGVPLLCTIWDGDVDVRPGRDGFSVRCSQ